MRHDHPYTPSHEIKEARHLTEIQREKAIIKYFGDMCSHYNNDPQTWRLKRTKTIQKILSPDSIKKIGWNEARKVTDCLHCLLSYQINKSKFLNPQNNRIEDIRECWYKLLHTGKIDYEKIKYVTNKLRNFGHASVYELIGWYYPNEYPLMNDTSQRGMKFFGYHINNF